MQLRKKIETPRNALCSCGSGIKYKKCCLQKNRQKNIDVKNINEMIEKNNSKKSSCSCHECHHNDSFCNE